MAAELNIKTFRNISTSQLTYHHAATTARHKHAESSLPPWIDGNVSLTHTDDDTAQVTPLELTNAMLDASKAKVLLDCEVVDFEKKQSAAAVSHVVLANGTKVECDIVVIAAGPWSGNIVKQVRC